MSNPEFSNLIALEKFNRIDNLPDFTNGKRDIEWFISFFQSQWIDIQSIRSFIRSESDWLISNSDKLIESTITLLSLDEWKDTIVSAILERWPFSNPKDLVHEIALYIKSRLSYDKLTALLDLLKNKLWKVSDKVLNEIVSNFQLDAKGALDLKNANDNWTLDNAILKIRLEQLDSNTNIWFNYYSLSLFRELIDRLNRSKEKLPENFKGYFKDISSFIDSNDPNWLEEYFSSQLLDDIWFKNFLLALCVESDLTNLWYNTDINHMLENVGIWVCRHYSIMMREIYNEVIRNWEWIDFSWESTMIYVSESSSMHAYNLLVYDEDWVIKKQYLDITQFIIWWKLFKKPSDIINIDWELWVKNNMPDNKNKFT